MNNSQGITFSTQSCLLLYSFYASLPYTFILSITVLSLSPLLWRNKSLWHYFVLLLLEIQCHFLGFVFEAMSWWSPMHFPYLSLEVSIQLFVLDLYLLFLLTVIALINLFFQWFIYSSRSFSYPIKSMSSHDFSMIYSSKFLFYSI